MTDQPGEGVPTVVLDTNWVLDLLVFDDPRALSLHAALSQGTWRWLVCDVMREELVRVLTYPAVAKRLASAERSEADVLRLWDALSCPVATPPPCRWRCADSDDQVFIDLAVQHRAHLLSKDHAVLRLRRSLAGEGVVVGADPVI